MPHAALALLLASLAVQETPRPPERVLRYYNLDGRLDGGELNEAAREAGLEIVRGPLEAASRPSNSFVAVSAPVEASGRELERALRRAGVKVEALEVFLFEGRVENAFPSFGGAVTELDYMLGISSDVRWCDMEGPATQFFCEEGELEAEELEDLWRKLQDPLGEKEATLGPVARDEIVWKLARVPEPREQKKLIKAIGKLDGVFGVAFENERLTVVVRIAGLETGGPATTFEGTPAERGDPLRATFSTAELWELLAEAELAGAE